MGPWVARTPYAYAFVSSGGGVWWVFQSELVSYFFKKKNGTSGPCQGHSHKQDDRLIMSDV
jgi:hypothetical protein